MVKENGQKILNRNKEGDWEEEYTYIEQNGKNTIVYYGITDEDFQKKIAMLKLENLVEANYIFAFSDNGKRTRHNQK